MQVRKKFEDAKTVVVVSGVAGGFSSTLLASELGINAAEPSASDKWRFHMANAKVGYNMR